MTGAVLLVVLLGLVAPLVLYALVRSEHDRRETMGWESAERAARRDASDPDPSGRSARPEANCEDGEGDADDAWGRENR